jgi:hypothetical protein
MVIDFVLFLFIVLIFCFDCSFLVFFSFLAGLLEARFRRHVFHKTQMDQLVRYYLDLCSLMNGTAEERRAVPKWYFVFDE